MTVMMKRDYVVRQATGNDLPRLCELEKLCVQYGGASRQQLRARLKRYPEGQFVVERDALVVGVLYSQRIPRLGLLDGATGANAHRLHDAAGPVVHLLALHLDPAHRAAGGDALLGFALGHWQAGGAVQQVALVAPSGTSEAGGALHAAHGARVVRSLPGYLPGQAAGMDNADGVLLVYELAGPGRVGESESADQAFLFVLSAASEERLQAYAARVAAWLPGRAGPAPVPHLADAIYTWQVGRTAMKSRLAIKAGDADALLRKLAAWIADPRPGVDTWSGSAGPVGGEGEGEGEGEDGLQQVAAALAARDWDRLGQLWTGGATIDWAQAYGGDGRKARRISVPTYPFARDRHWFEDSGGAAALDLEPDLEPAPAPAQLFVRPVWEPAPAARQAPAEGIRPVARHHVVLCKEGEVNLEQLAALIPSGACSHLLQVDPADPAESYIAHALACFEKIKEILAAPPRETVLLQVVVPNQPEPTLLAGLSGLLKTASEEDPRFIGQILLTNRRSAAALAEQLRHERERLDNAVVLYTRGVRHVLRWRPVPGAVPGVTAPAGGSYREGGVYLVTGGLGGLGQVFAGDLLRHAGKAQLVLTGRTPLSGARQRRFEQLSRQALAQGGKPVAYRQLDLDSREQVAQLIADILQEHKQLNGILHSAGMVADNRILNKTADEFRQVLAPKVAGTLHLDEATRDVDLDFFVLFSSATSVFGNAGQADYAAANGFMDQFAAYRNRLVDGKERSGHTLALNWPLWQEGGMAMPPAGVEALRRSAGLRPLHTSTGLRIFHASLAAKCDQAMVLEGEADKIAALLAGAHLVSRAQAPAPALPMLDGGRLAGALHDKLKALFAGISKRPLARIDVHEDLASYGIDSILIGSLNAALSEVFGDISKTLFFECRNLAEVAAYCIARHPAECAAWTGLAAQAQAQVPALADAPVADVPAPAAADNRPTAGAGTLHEPIAIIGISGIYPQAANIEEFWANLRAGRDCIGEIPAERWPLDDFYEPDVDRAVEQGKSYSKWGGFIDQFADFDPLFFSISPREAMNMDPQERLFLQECWRTLENAGYTRADLKSQYGQKVGVFTGITKPGYNLYALHPTRADEPFLPYTSFSSAANRISYFLDLTGPSMPIDTMCSSSLVALHEACEHIGRGECEVAFAGGVNLYLHPYTYNWLCSHRMLSRDGACRSFGAGGNGFVPGEGVGMVLLKPLSSAIRDNDNIQGVILATQVNHGGKTSGFTVPSPRAQADVIRRAIDKAGIKATDIAYIEAHGTGTELGDPIEIAGLQQAFAADSQETGYCSIGSAKSGIGHLEAAAGIAGLTKVLLQMKHREIVPSLHAEQLNPNIAFERSAFRVNTALAPWPAPASGPRIAGISSFGAAGANAHVIVREYVAPVAAAPAWPQGEPVVVALSARTPAQLLQRARDLLRFVRGAPALDLSAMAYTLQVGREAMAERLACLVTTVDGLDQTLQAFVDGKSDMPDCYRGQAGAAAQDALRLFAGDDDFHDTLDKWIARRKLARLAELWARGVDLDWHKLYGALRPPRITLPTYPFASEKLWAAAVVEPVGAAARAGAHRALHPLLHSNTSDLSQQRYTSLFSGDEFFLRDHQVRGMRILPAVAYLEMARAAVGLALPAPPEGGVVELRNTTWAQPLAVSGPREVRIALLPDAAGGALGFDIRSAAAGAGEAGATLHCQGQAVSTSTPPPARLDLGRIMAEMTRGQEDVPGLYDNYRRMGVEFGAAHRALDTVYLGERQLLARLCLPEAAGASTAYVLHPGLMDGALQASIGLMDEAVRGSSRPFLPFALDLLRVFAPCSGEMFAWVRCAPGPNLTDGLIRFDVDLCDGDGKVCVQLHGLSSRVQEDAVTPRGQAAQTARTPPQLHAMTPGWTRVTPATAGAHAVPATARVLVLGCGPAALAWARQSCPGAVALALPPREGVADIAARLAAAAFDHLLWVAPDVAQADAGDDGASIVAAQEAGVLTVLRVAKALLALGYAHRALEWTLVTRDTQRVKAGERIAPAHAAIAGLAGSMAKEYPEWGIRLLDIESLAPLRAADCLALAADKQGPGLAHRQGEWFRQDLVRIAGPASPTSTDTPAWRQGGVYVVIGGAGGIGEAWSRHMAERYQARLVWIGRRPLDAAIGRKIAALATHGPAPLYLSADASSLASLQEARRAILAVYPRIDAVVHSAIDLQDASIALMDDAAFRSSLAAKVDVSVNLDRVFGGHDLDCMLFFSSLISFTRGAGQSNYAAGCTFKDSFAHSLAQRRPYPVKVMNWGYWGKVGVVSGEFYNQRMEQMGIGSIEAPEAMDALEQLVSSGFDQMALVKTLDPGVIDGLAPGGTLIRLPAAGAGILEGAVHDLHAARGRPAAGALERDLLGPDTEKLAAGILGAVLVAGGLFDPAGVGGSAATRALDPRWLDASVDYLRRHGCGAATLDEAWADWHARKGAWLANANLRAQVELVEACLHALPAILAGTRRATDVLFPDSSMALVEGVYKGHALADHANDVLGAALVACIRRKLAADPEASIRIVEIGAGTGGTTARILPLLSEFSGSIADYCYTDLSRAFLMHAEELYQPRLPALSTAIFDVSKPAQGQAVALHRYDIAIATNVLHATPDIRATLRNTKALLKNQGVLLINEMCGWSLFSHLTFGLLEGWWLYEDSALRLAGSPGLSPDKWQQVLREEGFDGVAFLAGEAHALGQQIVAAASDGVVRQGRVQVQVQEQVQTQAEAQAVVEPAAVVAPDDAASLRARCIAYLQGVVGKALRMDAAQVGAERPLTEYGLDSILVVGLTNQLRKAFPETTTTLLFEVQHIAGLADRLLAQQHPHALTLFGPGAGSPAAVLPAIPNAHGQAAGRFMPAVAPAVPSAPGATPSDVAIIGLSGRYPQARNLDEFWHNLANGKNCVTEIPAGRWDWQAYYDSDKGKAGTMYTKWGGFLDDIDCFDPLFFRISPKEAKIMDPQERLFLECCYHAIEDAGYTPDTLGDKERVGVFAGVMNARYNAQPLLYSIANRVSFVMNFQGPSLAVDTACSSSLTALHLALESICSGASECALAGGVNLIVDPVHLLELSALTMLSGGNACKSFGDGADGFVDAEGVGVVLLKPLARALRDGDHVYGVIKGSAINAGGRTNGYTVPNPVAQAAVVTKALQRANMRAADISYVEAHGTGTALGDPIEIAGLARAFEEAGGAQSCAIGSLKSNIGHCESAAGIAALTKVLLQFRHRQLVPSLHAETSNREIDFGRTPFRIQARLAPWTRQQREAGGVTREVARTAGISSFGAGGANAHLIVQEYEAPAVAARTPGPVIVPLSARTAEQLRQKADALLRFVRAAAAADVATDLAALGYTLQVGREPMEERFCVVVDSAAELERRLGAWLGGEAAGATWLGRVRRTDEGADARMQQEAVRAADEGDLARLAAAWVGGARVEWQRLYGPGMRPGRISLPTYPFARERYWRARSDTAFANAVAGPAANAAPAPAALHPLLHRNLSDLRQQCYGASFSGAEFFVAADPLRAATGGARIVPPMVYLEMARAALEHATASAPQAIRARRSMELLNLVWADPAAIDRPRQLGVAVFDQGEERLGVEIYSMAADGAEEAIHFQGQAVLHAAAAPARIDLARIRAQLPDRREGRAHYDRMAAGGLQVAAACQAIGSLQLGDGQLLAELVMPEALAGDPLALDAALVLHPTMLGGALQAAFDLLAQGRQAASPLAMASLRIVGACTSAMLAWVRRSSSAGAQVDIDLCDPQGNVCVALRGIAYEGELPELLVAQASVPAPRLESRVRVLDAPQTAAFAPAATAAKPTSIALAFES